MPLDFLGRTQFLQHTVLEKTHTRAGGLGKVGFVRRHIVAAERTPSFKYAAYWVARGTFDSYSHCHEIPYSYRVALQSVIISNILLLSKLVDSAPNVI